MAQHLRKLPLLAAAALLALHPGRADASSDRSGPCSGRIQNLGFRHVKLENVQAHVSLYEAYRDNEEVKLMVENGSCTVRQTWVDD